MNDSPVEQIPYLSPTRLKRLAISTQDVIDSIEHLICGQAAGTVWSAPKSVLTPRDGRYIMATLAAADDPPVVSAKLLVLNLRNSARGLPDINSLVTLLDSDTGVPLAVMDGNWVTAVRTAGLSGVAARRMAGRCCRDPVGGAAGWADVGGSSLLSSDANLCRSS